MSRVKVTRGINQFYHNNAYFRIDHDTLIIQEGKPEYNPLFNNIKPPIFAYASGLWTTVELIEEIKDANQNNS